MKLASRICTVLGVIAFLLAVLGRFFGPSSIRLLGDAYASATFLLITNTFLLAAILFRMTDKSS